MLYPACVVPVQTNSWILRKSGLNILQAMRFQAASWAEIALATELLRILQISRFRLIKLHQFMHKLANVDFIELGRIGALWTSKIESPRSFRFTWV